MSESQSASILTALQAGRGLTPADALRDFGCFRLAARIYDLRQEGHSIATYWEQSETRRWAVYHLLKTRKQAHDR